MSAKVNLSVQLGPLTLRSPVMTASGTCGYGEELAEWVDFSRLGALVVKTVTRQARAGNPTPRTCETAAGMLNAIGLQNVGVERFIAEKLPFLRQIDVPVIVNIAGETVEDFGWLAEQIGQQPGIAALELNISCPNVAHGLDFATDPVLAEHVTTEVCRRVDLPVIVKLSPNVTDITVIARAVEAGGAHALSLVNTFIGLAIDSRTRKPRLANLTGGLSGPAIKPLALRAVNRCAGAVKIPLIGIGGISTGEDAAEFLLAGASAVQVGTATFVQPDAPVRVVEELENFCREQGFCEVNELVGGLIG